MRLNSRREMFFASIRAAPFIESKVIGNTKTSQEPPSAARSPYFRFKMDFASDVPEPSPSRDAARKPFAISKSPVDGYLLTLKRSSKTVYSAGRDYIYVGGRLRLATADGIGIKCGACLPGRGATEEVFRLSARLQILVWFALQRHIFNQPYGDNADNAASTSSRRRVFQAHLASSPRPNPAPGLRRRRRLRRGARLRGWRSSQGRAGPCGYSTRATFRLMRAPPRRTSPV